MYTLEFYDKIRDIEWKYNFSNPISPQQALDIFNKMGFDVYPYTKVEQHYQDMIINMHLLIVFLFSCQVITL